jgi:hypothetical protein
MIRPIKKTAYLLSSVLLASFCLSACNKGPADSAKNPNLPAKAPAASSARTSSTDVRKPVDKSVFDSLSGAVQPTKTSALNLGEFKIVDILLGTRLDSDNAVDSASIAFKPKDKVYASVFSTGKHAGLKMQARWTAPDGRLVAKTEQLIMPTGAMVTTFSIDHDQAWPVGAYSLEVSLNEQVQKTTSFEIR